MSLDRRHFLGLLGLLGAAPAPQAAAQAQSGSSPTPYEEIQRKLAGAKLYFVPYSHNDASWFATETWHWERAARIDERAVEILRREDNFKWFIDVKLERIDRVADLKPNVFEELKRFAAQGRVGIAAGSVANNDNPFNEPEAAIRNMVLGRRFFEKTFPGVNLDVACFIDIHPGHTQMPQMLAKAGYKYYRFTRPIWAMDRKGYKREFIWEGLDGSDVLLTYGPYGWLAGGWGMGKGPGGYLEEINGYKQDWEKAVEALYDSALRHLMPNSTTNIIWIPVGLDHTLPLSLPRFDEASGGEPSVDLPGMVREWQKRESVPLSFATPADFFTELEKKRASLPRVQGIIDPVGWPFWYGQCGSKGLDNWRDRTNRYLVEAEIYSSLAAAAGAGNAGASTRDSNTSSAPYPEKELEDLWHKALTLYPHDGLYVGDEDMADSIEIGRDVVYHSKQLRKRAETHIRRHIKADPDQQTIAVFNPLSWRRREPIEIKAVFVHPGVTKISVVDAQGRKRPHQLLRARHFNNPSEHLTPGAKNSYKEIWMLVDVEAPALGYTTLKVTPESGDEEPNYIDRPTNSLESRYARVTLGEGGVEVLEDKLRGVKYPGAGNPIYYKHDDPWPWHGGPIKGEDRIRDARWTLVEDGPLRSAARMSAKLGDHQISIRLDLYHEVERIDYRVDIDSVGGSGYFAANVVFDDDALPYAGIPFGAEIRDLSKEPWGDGSDPNEELLRKDVFFAHHWVDHSAGDKGITLLAAEGKRGFLFHPEKKSLEHILMMTIVPRGEMETLFANPYFTGQGRHSFRYSLVPHSGDWRQVRAAQRAQQKVHPLHWIHVHSRKGADLAGERSFVSTNPDTVAASSWLWHDGAYELRLYDASGRGGPVEVRLPRAASACEAVDFNGRPLPTPAVAIQGDTARFTIRPWEIVTLRFSLNS